jgi:integrase
MVNMFRANYRRDFDLIVSQPDGSPLKPDSISASVSALIKRLKLPKGVSLHTLRHTQASQLLADGMDVATVSKRLGHTDSSTTMRVYAHVIQGRDRAAAEMVEKRRAKSVLARVSARPVS